MISDFRSGISDLATAVILLCLVFGLAGASQAAPSIEWQRGPDLPSPRDYLGCGMVDGLFVVAGGAYWENDQKHYGRGTIAYSRLQDRWITLPDLPMPGAYGASAVIGNQLLIAGGADGTGALKRCFRLRRVEGRLMWDRLPDLPRPIWGASGAAVGTRFYVFGGAPGMDVRGMKAARPSLLMLDLSAVSPRWAEFVGPGMPAGRVGAAAAVVGSKLYVFGGYGLQADGNLGNFGDAYAIDLDRKPRAWARIDNMPVASRWSTARAVTQGVRPTGLTDPTGPTAPTAPEARYLMIAGGYAENPVRGFLDRVWLYDTVNGDYLPCGPLPLAACTMASGVAEDGTIYLAGGEDAMRHRSASFFIGRPPRE